MATNTKKDKFYSVLKNIFIGAKIEGNSGYVNLMRIKNKYYQGFKGQLATDIDKKLDEVGRNFEEELYNKLYTFFKKYFSESGSIYFSYTPLQEKVYERIYRDDKDVMLFWKTNMLYYVKTERLYQNMDFQDEDNQIWYHFDVSELEHKKNNEKKELIFEYDKSWHEDNKREIFFKVKYSKNGSKTKIDDILKKVKKSTKAFGSYKEQELKRALGIFRKQSEVDYFINKNAKEFLQEQFSLWIKTYVFDDDTIFEEERLKQLKALRNIAYNIIDLVSQFEDELVKIWNKPKFAHSSNYVITLDKISDKDLTLLEKLLKHKGIAEQVKEWQELGMCNDKFKIEDIFTKEPKNKEIFEKENTSVLNKKWQYLPLDTKYFKDFEFDILALFDDLDNQLDGWLIHSENYQALNTIKYKFYKKVDTVYIDPPYNAKSSEIIYVNNYKSSSWLSFMENRLSVTKLLLKDTGLLEVAIDDYENKTLNLLLDNVYRKENFIASITVVHNPRGRNDDKFFGTQHEYMLVYAKDKSQANIFDFELTAEEIKQYNKKDSISPYTTTSFMRTGNNSDKVTRPNLYYPIYYCKSTNDFSLHQKEGYLKLYPINEAGEEKTWRWGKDTFLAKCDTEIEVKDVKNVTRLFKKRRLLDDTGKKPKTVWASSKYDASSSGISILKNLFGRDIPFTYPKSINTVYDAIEVSINSNSIILDYFGGSGTTVEAVIKLNNNKKLRNKYIVVELGDHFNTALLPRTKKISFTDNWKDGKAQDGGQGYSNFFKYYELEQYEEALRNAKYEDKGALPKDIYHQYLFFKDLKLTNEVVKLDDESKSIKVDLTKLHDKIDIPETLSFLTGKFIKQILKDKVVFTDGSEIEYANIDYKIVKPLIWW